MTPKAPLIAHVIFRLDVGGLENGLVNLINGLPHDDYRHAVICIDRSTDFANRIKRDDVEIIDIRKREGFDLSALWRLYKTIKSLSPDILHTRNLAALDALLPGLLGGVRYRIHGEHGWDVDDLQGQNKKLKWLRKLHSPLISQYVTVSRDLKNYLTKQVGIAPSRIKQIYNGVNIQTFFPRSVATRNKSKMRQVLGEDTIVIGTVGRIASVKDHMTLVSAFIELVRKHPTYAKRVRLAIIGDGSLRNTLLSKLKDAGVGHLCWLPGTRSDIPDIIAGLDIFVQSSLAEGISNTILEAMASGVPIVATNVGGNTELIKIGENGVIVTPSDVTGLAQALESYVEDDDKRTSSGEASRARAVDVFSIENMLRNYSELYQNALSHHR